MTVAFIEAVIEASQSTPFRGRGGYGVAAEQLRSDEPEIRFAQAFTEASVIDRFYSHYPDLPAALKDKTVLDFGCGYGGKTVEFGKHAKAVAGIEPFDNVVELAEAYRQHVGAKNVEFKLCPHKGIPYPDASFDVVLSHDVLEHVEDPEVSLCEIARVLKPCGVAYIVCPPYDGAFSHHLDYVTLLPGLHWLFSADTLVRAVNKVLKRRDFGTSQQPEPQLSWSGERKVLPCLNGLTGPQFETLAARYFETSMIKFYPIGFGARHPLGRAVRVFLTPFLNMAPAVRDRVTLTMGATLANPSASSPLTSGKRH